jgi:hypothetical protein
MDVGRRRRCCRRRAMNDNRCKKLPNCPR